MKTWLFALMESTIAAVGLAAYFLANNVLLATVAALLAAALGIAHPLISAHKGRKLAIYHERQYQQSLDAVDSQMREMLDDASYPPLPHRPTVVAEMRRRFGGKASRLIRQYDAAVEALVAGHPDATSQIASLAETVTPWSLVSYLHGLAALQADYVATAHKHFRAAAAEQTSWIAPWLGWATTAYRQGRFDEICKNHPHVCGVELLPYDAGGERSFLELSEHDREELGEAFQRAAVSLGNYYTIAELSRSRQEMESARDEFRKVA